MGIIKTIGDWTPAIVSWLGNVSVGAVILFIVKYRYDQKAMKSKMVFEQKLTVVREVSTKLWKLQKSVANYVSLMGPIIGPQRSQDGQEFLRCLEDLADSFEPNRIFFTEDIADKIDKLCEKLKNAGMEFATQVHRTQEGVQQKTNKWVEVSKFVQKESVQIRREIEREIRKDLS